MAKKEQSYILNVHFNWRADSAIDSRVVSEFYLDSLLPRVISPIMDVQAVLREIKKMEPSASFKVYNPNNGHTLEVFKHTQAQEATV